MNFTWPHQDSGGTPRADTPPPPAILPWVIAIALCVGLASTLLAMLPHLRAWVR